MSPHPQISTKAFAIRVAAFYAALIAVNGVQTPFYPVWLSARGLAPAEIGILLAVPLIVRVLAIPVVAGAADRRGALQTALVAGALASTAGMVALALAGSFAAMLAVAVVLACTHTPMMPITDAYALKGLRDRGRSYGPVRLWGSASFIASTLVAGVFLDLVPARHLIWLAVAFFAVTAFCATRLPPLTYAPASSDDPPPRGITLLRSKAFLAAVAAASLIQASHGFYYAFGSLDWTGRGFNGFTIAALWSLGVVAEIVLFALQPRFPRWSPTILILVGGAGGMLRWSLMALSPPGVLLPLLQVLHGLSFGATYLGSVAFMARAAPERLGATAQGYLSTATGIAMAAAMSLSGQLFGAYGDLGYAAMALMALAGFGFALAAHRLSAGR